MVKLNHGHVFWGVWALVMAGAGGVYFAAIAPTKAQNYNKANTKLQLASRFIKVEKDQLSGGTPIVLEEDQLIKDLYPFSTHLSIIPTKFFSTDGPNSKKAVEEGLRNERATMAGKCFPAYQFAVDPDKDFSPRPPDNPEVFRQWVMLRREGQDQKIDEEIGKLAGNRKLIAFQTSSPDGALKWLSDGRCSGFIGNPDGSITVTDRQKVLKRLVLRRLVLKAVVRTRAPVLSFDGGKESKEDKDKKIPADVPSKLVERGVDWVESLGFQDETDHRAGIMARYDAAHLQPLAQKLPYRGQWVELVVHCHPGVVSALLRELERVGEVENRPFAFWAERLAIERVPGKLDDWSPGIPQPQEEDRPPDFGGRYWEWPARVHVFGVVPEFDADALDPEVK